jgi:WD40 repeat protein
LENSSLNLSAIAESEPTAKPVAILTGHPSYVQAIAITSDGQILASRGDDNSIKIWNLAQGIRTRTLRAHSKPVHAIAISPDKKLVASGSYHSTIKIWQVPSQQ